MDVTARDADLADAIRDNFRAQVLAIGHLAPRGAVLVTDHVIASHVGTRSVFNRATALDADQPDLALSAIERFFGPHRHSIWVDGESADALDPSLRARGYILLGHQAGMAGTGVPPPPDHPHVELLADPALATAAGQVAASGYGLGFEDRIVLEDLCRAVLRHAKPFDRGAVYAVREHGAMVAMGLLMCTPGVAGMVGLSTVPERRHQGLGSAVARRAFHDAAALGYGVAGAIANPESSDLLGDLGLRPVAGFRVYRQASL